LTVEFCRTKTHACLYSDSGLPTSTDARVFNYTYPPTCNLTCSAVTGPFSRIRQGSANNVFVVPAPERITFGMGTLFSAGCCIPPVLYLMSIWIKILKHNWTEDWAIREDDEQGAGGSTKATPGNIKELARKILDYESLVIGALVVCILVLGELNFSSAQVNWQSEPMSAIGRQCSPLTRAR
jgi:hypothetical protein